jgi:Leucine-rich repeat (LRR) protein
MGRAARGRRLVVALGVLLGLSGGTGWAAIPEAERNALVALYDSTAGPGWTEHAGWLGAAGTECTWRGVTCDQAGEHVVDLDLRSNNLTGPLPAEIGDLSRLAVAEMFDNHIAGPLPSALGNLKELRILDLYLNAIDGPLPPALGTMAALEELWLGYNALSGAVPGELGGLASLTRLSLHTNQLTGPIPGELGHLAKLKSLSLDANQLTGEIPAALGDLEALETLDLSGNQLAGAIPAELGQLSHLQDLYLEDNRLTGSLPGAFGNLSALTQLWLWSNQLSGPIPAELGSLAELRQLELQYNQLSGPIPAQLGQLVKLESLDLYSNQLSGAIPVELAALGELQTLSLGSNKLSGSIPVALSALTRLKTLLLSFNQLAGPLPPALGGLASLQELYLGGNQLDGGIPDAYGNLLELRALGLSGNRLTGAIPAWLGSLANLKELGLNNNQLTGPIPPELGALGQLVWLDVSANALSGPLPASLGGLGKLQALEAYNNRLSGSIPPSFGNLGELRYLILSANQLTGPLPGELGRLSKLEGLHLDSNHLEGPIPPGFAGLGSLTVLDLDWNRLSGPLPAWLGSLPALDALSLTGNRLSGPIPSELGAHSHLHRLALGSNALGGAIPASLGQVTSLVDLDLAGNMLVGPIPVELGGLASLADGNGLDLRYNALTASGLGLVAFLASKQVGGDWESSQTLPPGGLTATAGADGTVTLGWAPVVFQSGAGGTRVLFSTLPAGPFSLFATTASKADTSVMVTGLEPGTAYSFELQTETRPHGANPNTVLSAVSAQVSATTTGTTSPRLYPGVARANGANATVWRSEGVFCNAGKGEANVLLEVAPRGGQAVAARRAVSLGAGEVRHIADVYSELGLENGAGTLRVRGGALAWLRTYNLGSTGTFGEDVVAAQDATYAAGEEVLFPVQTPADPAREFRSNLLLQNLEARDITMSLAASGLSKSVTVPAGAYIQIDKVGLWLGLPAGASVLHATADGSWSGTVSTVDPFTGDPATAHGERPTARTEALYPGIASAGGNNNTVWRSQGTFYNATAAPVELALAIIPRGASSPTASKALTLQPGEVRQLDDLYLALGAGSGAGALRVTGNALAWLRTYNQGSAGSFGQDVVEATANAFAPGDEVAFAVERPVDLASGFRSNLLLQNLESRQTVVTLRSGSHACVVNLGAGVYAQLNNVGQVLGVPVGSAVVTVTGDGAWSGSVSTVDPATGDPTTVRGLPLP